MTTFIDPPPVSLPVTLQTAPESPYFQANADVLYQLWDAMRKLGTSNSTIINDTDLGGTQHYIIECSDETSGLTAGNGKVTLRMPAFEISDIRASVSTAAVGATLLTVDIGVNGTSILSTKLTFDSGEKTTVTAAIQRVITQTTLALDDEIRIDILSVGNSVAGAGLKVTISGTPL
jgi:hypothetical protein